MTAGVQAVFTLKMRHQRGRVRPTVRPSEYGLHPDRSVYGWSVEVLPADDIGFLPTICSHCRRWTPCPSLVYVHGRDGHTEACGGLWGWGDRFCDIVRRGAWAREHEVLP